MLTESIYMGKYPIHSVKLPKSDTHYQDVPALLDYFKEKIDSHPMAAFIATFDNYTHTQSHGGEINPDILDAQIIVFCFGPAIPDTGILAARPRNLAVAEHNDSFTITFLEAPKEPMQEAMRGWVSALLAG